MKFFASTLALFLCFLAAASAQVEARIHQVFDAQKAQKIDIKIVGSKYEVNTKETYSTVIVVEAIVTLNHATPEVLEDLIKQGRYHLKMDNKSGVLTFSLKHENHPPVIIGGKEAEEYVIYNISLPEYLVH